MSAPTPTQVPAAEPLSPAEVARARKDFPYLARPARNGQELAYLDWAATAQKPQCVLDAEFRFYRMSNGAAGRSTYQLADEATASLEDAREAVAAFVGARASQLVFTKNATEAINLVALAIGHASLGRPAAGGPGAAPASDPARRLALGPGDEVVVTRAEHHANLVPWQELCARTGATLRWLDLDGAGRIDLAGLDVLTARTRVLALGHASNVTGAIAPLAPVLDAARAAGSAAGSRSSCWTPARPRRTCPSTSRPWRRPASTRSPCPATRCAGPPAWARSWPPRSSSTRCRRSSPVAP